MRHSVCAGHPLPPPPPPLCFSLFVLRCLLLLKVLFQSAMPRKTRNAEYDEAELVSTNIENKKHNFFVFSIYRPPNSSKQLFKDYISNLSQNFNNKPLLLLGDLNIDILDEINNLDFCNVMYSQNFFPLINIPTRITNTTAKCLDHIWYNSFNSVRSGSFILDISDHYPVFTTLNVDYNNEPIKQIFRNHSQANIDNLIERI